nr:efflux RND transporter periplasmic adaptor subunit [uncultured Gellertiella sp.]
MSTGEGDRPRQDLAEGDLPLLIDRSASQPGRSSAARWLWLLLPVLLIAGLLAWRFLPLGQDQATALAPAAGTVKSDIFGLGTILPRGRVLVIAPPSGSGDARIARIEVAEGQTVSAGEVLARLDNQAQLEAMVDVARSAVDARQAALEQTRVAVFANRAEAEAALARGEAQAENAASDFARSEALAKRGVIAGDLLDSKRTLMRETRLEAERLKAVLTRFAVADPERQVDVLLAAKTLEQARADFARAKADLEKAVVRAPVSGTILKIMARSGERAASQGIFRLADLADMTVDVEVYQTDIGRVQTGDTVDISSDSLPRPMKGRVERIGLEVGKQVLVDTSPAANTDARVVIATVALAPGDTILAARFTNLQVTAAIHARPAPPPGSGS